ncbi:MAG: hypothetical protein QGD94_10835 [Planctomycetia bacterium]|nr:hypothetical protein [Planctomycetia bacterium]
MRRAVVAIFVIALVGGALAEDKAAPDEVAFRALLEKVKKQRGHWGWENRKLSHLFNEERKRLADNFEKELLKFIDKDIDRHYWASAFLTTQEYLHGSTPRPYLALAILEQGLVLCSDLSDIEVKADVVSLSVCAAVLSEKLGFHALAVSHKGAAKKMLTENPVLAGASPAMGKEELKIYESIPLEADKQPRP